MWAGGGDSPDLNSAELQDLLALGLHDAAKSLQNEAQNNVVYVWPENWDAVQYFEALSDQWLFAPMGGAIGMIGSTVIQYIQLNGLSGDDATRMYRDIKHIASGALTAWREQSERNK